MNKYGQEITRTERQILYTAEDVKNYLNDRMRMVSDIIRKAHRELSNMKDITVYVRSIDISKQFAPMLVTMPTFVTTDVFDRKVKTSTRVRIPSVFSDNNEYDTKQLIPAVQSLFQPYMYSDEEIKALKNYTQDVRHLMPRDRAIKCSEMTRPFLSGTKSSFNNEPSIAILLDPVKIFVDIAKPDESSKQYEVTIKKLDRLKKNKGTIIRYIVSLEVVGNRDRSISNMNSLKNNADEIVRSLERRDHGRNKI